MAEYRIRVPQVVHEAVDGEVVAIDFTTGSYFSLRGPAEAAWSALTGDEARDVATVTQSVADRFADEADPGRVGTFLDQLVDEGLLDRTGEAATNGHGTGGLTFEKFTDMEELILLDPVHDVSEAGWPNAPT
jgi:Coenzyme PQQ synthesis protein D (PqqD)